MKAIREYIQEIQIDRSNLEYIAKTGRINGSLLLSIEKAFKLFSKELLSDAYTSTERQQIQERLDKALNELDV